MKFDIIKINGYTVLSCCNGYYIMKSRRNMSSLYYTGSVWVSDYTHARNYKSLDTVLKVINNMEVIK